MTFKKLDERSLPAEVVRRKFFACEKASGWPSRDAPQSWAVDKYSWKKWRPPDVDSALFLQLRQMSMDQAIHNLEDLDHGFYIFRDQTSGELQVGMGCWGSRVAAPLLRRGCTPGPVHPCAAGLSRANAGSLLTPCLGSARSSSAGGLQAERRGLRCDHPARRAPERVSPCAWGLSGGEGQGGVHVCFSASRAAWPAG